MAVQVKLRRNDPAKPNASAAFVGAQGEVVVDLGLKTLRVHDGATAGGTILAKLSELSALSAAFDAKMNELKNEMQQMINDGLSDILPGFDGTIDEETGKAHDAGKVLGITDTGEIAWLTPTGGTGYGTVIDIENIMRGTNETEEESTTTAGDDISKFLYGQQGQ